MRLLILSLASFFALAACGDPQPMVYRVAIDISNLRTVPATCYNNNTVPPDLETGNPLIEQQWTIWQGKDEKSSYLELPSQSYTLGSNQVRVPDAGGGVTIIGGPKVWTVVETDPNTGASNTNEETLTYTFDQNPGSTGTGTILVRENNTNTTNFRSCEATLSFFARRIPIGDSTTIVQP